MKKEVPKAEVGFITVINIIVGIIIAIFFLLTLIMSLYLASALFLVISVFIFLPQKILRFSKWLKLLIGVVGFFVILAILGSNMPSQEPVYEFYNLNETFILNYDEVNVSMVVYNVSKEYKILLGGEERTTEGVFIKVDAAIINLIKLPVSIGISVSMMDVQNNTYTTLGSNLGEGSLQPNLKREIFYIFELPKEATGLRFVVTENKKHLIEINLGI